MLKPLSSYWDGIKQAMTRHGDMLLFLLAITVLLLMFFRPNSGKPIIQQSEIVFTHFWTDDKDREILFSRADEFEKLRKKTKISFIEKFYEELRNELYYGTDSQSDPQIPARRADLLVLDTLWVPDLMKEKKIETITGESISSINVLFYNIDILKKAGYSKPPDSRGEFILYCKKAYETEKDNPPLGLAIDLDKSRGVYDDIYPWIWAAGTQLIKDGIPAFNTRQLGESLSFLLSLHNEGLILPEGDKLENFIKGRAAFMTAPACTAGYISDQMGADSFGITSVPRPDNFMGKSFFAGTAWIFAVSSESSRREEAKYFAEFLMGKEPFLSGVPQLFQSKLTDIEISGETAKDFTGLEGVYELGEIFRDELADLFSGKSSGTGAAENIHKRWQEQLQ